MVDYSCKHYQIKCAKIEDACKEYTEQAKSYADSVNPDRFLNKEMITNCITEIPQDIKLELNNGTLTLKAGSKVYVPNGKNADGSNKFDEVVISTDKTLGAVGTYTGYSLLYVHSNGSALNQAIVSESISGTTQPSGNGAWYDTGTNLIKIYSGGSDTGTRVSFPIAILHRTSGSWDAIGQVFNGFGYIGSTVFALPNVKGLIPNGRNADGSLKNTEFTVDSVWLGQTAYDTNKATLGVVPIRKILNYVTYNDVVYNEEENKNRQVGDGDHWRGCLAGSVAVSDMKFTSLTPKQAFHAVDRNDSSWVAQQAMPSGKYIDLTLGASGSTYIAPANGYVYLDKRVGATDIKFMTVVNVTKGLAHRVWATGSQATNAYTIFCSVNKGDVFRVDYNFTGTTNDFAFIYCEGEK